MKLNKKVAITGISGFIGFHLANRLKSSGYEVVGFDNLNDYYEKSLKIERKRILNNKGIKIDTYDLRNPDEMNSFMDENKPDAVVHLAAYAGVRHSVEAPNDYIQNNIVGTHNLIEAMKASGVENVLYASTSCVMAGNELPWKEDEKCGYQLNPYGYSKFTNESQFMSSDFKNAIGLRFFTVYGPWGRPDMALFSFTKNIIAGNPITLFNYGDMKRDFTYIDDIIDGIEILVNRIGWNDGEKEIYNIGNGRQVQLLDFVKEIEKNLGRKSIHDLQPKHPADTQETWSDTTKLRALGYNPKISIPTGVENFVKWYKDYYGKN